MVFRERRNKNRWLLRLCLSGWYQAYHSTMMWQASWDEENFELEELDTQRRKNREGVIALLVEPLERTFHVGKSAWKSCFTRAV